VSRAYLDTNFLFGLFRHEEGHGQTDSYFADWRQRVEQEIGGDRPVLSALVVDEISYRLVLAWMTDAGVKDPLSAFRADTTGVMKRSRGKLLSLWKSIAKLEPELAPSEEDDVVLAQNFMVDAGLAPRDAFHAAHAIRARCQWIVSSDDAFDRLDRMKRLGPRA
jgi:predicted nucleic acid-binding protein